MQGRHVRGFTLAELLVVIAIVAVFASIAITIANSNRASKTIAKLDRIERRFARVEQRVKILESRGAAPPSLVRSTSESGKSLGGTKDLVRRGVISPSDGDIAELDATVRDLERTVEETMRIMGVVDSLDRLDDE